MGRISWIGARRIAASSGLGLLVAAIAFAACVRRGATDGDLAHDSRSSRRDALADDAGASTDPDANAEGGSDAEADTRAREAVALRTDAPMLAEGAPFGLNSGESERTARVDGAFQEDIPFPTDGCIRVVWSASGPVVARLGRVASAVPATHGVVAPSGVVCERAGRHLTLSFAGRANVRYRVFR